MPRPEYVLSFDFGTTMCKASAFTTTGRVLCEFSVPNPVRYQGGGIYDQDVKPWKSAVAILLAKSSRALATRARVISVTGQGSFPVCLDREDRVIDPTVPHLDKRPLGHAKRLVREFGQVSYSEMKIFSALMWLRDNFPTRFNSVKKVMDAKEYVGFLLCGRVTHDPKGMPNVRRLSDFMGLDPSAFGEEHSYFRPAGELRRELARKTGLSDQVPIEVGPNDGFCAAVGAGAIERGTFADVSGTTEVMAAAVLEGSKAVVVPNIFPSVSMFYSSAPFGVIFEWFKSNFYSGKEDSYRKIEKDANAAPAGSDGAAFIISSKVENYSYDATWSFVGLNQNHSRKHVARAVLECFAFLIARETDFLRSCGEEQRRIVLGGGGAKSQTLNRMKADVTGLPVHIPQTLNVTSLGSAILGAVSVGVYREAREGVGGMVKYTTEIRPNLERKEKYEKIKAAWQRTTAAQAA